MMLVGAVSVAGIMPSYSNRFGAPHDRERYFDLQLCSASGPGSDFESAADGFYPLVHADQAESFAPRRIHVKPHAIIDDRQSEPACAIQMQRHVARLAVLDRVLQRFLSDSE